MKGIEEAGSIASGLYRFVESSRRFEERHMAQMRICFIGDSFVSGAYDDECLGWVGRW